MTAALLNYSVISVIHAHTDLHRAASHLGGNNGLALADALHIAAVGHGGNAAVLRAPGGAAADALYAGGETFGFLHGWMDTPFRFAG